MKVRKRRLLSALIGALALQSCAPKVLPRTATMQEAGVTETTAVARVYLNEYLRFFTEELETMTDRILAAEDDLEIRSAALRLRVNAAPSMQAAVLQREPIAALSDAWALTSALRRFLEDGNGRDVFGGSQAIAVATFRELEEEVVALVDQFVGPAKREAATPDFETWLREHPIESLSLGISPKGLEFAERTAASLGSGGLQSVANLDETARELSDRLTVYAELLPGEARRQGELLLVEARRALLAEPFDDVSSIEERFVSLEANVDRLTGFVLGADELIASERSALLESVGNERAIVLDAVDHQRVETLEALRQEREAIQAAVEELRRATFADLGAETERSLNRIDALRVETLRDLERASKAAIDHLFWRALMLLLIALVGAFGMAVLIRRPRSASVATNPNGVAHGPSQPRE